MKNIDSFHLKPASATGLIKGVSIILTSMPHQHIHAAMETLCAMHVRE